MNEEQHKNYSTKKIKCMQNTQQEIEEYKMSYPEDCTQKVIRQSWVGKLTKLTSDISSKLK